MALKSVNYNFTPVTGSLSLLKGNQSIEFIPDQSFAFNAQIQVELHYDGQLLKAYRFNIRPLPTQISGTVQDQFGQALSGISIMLPELGRTTQTNKEGSYSFGYNEDHQPIELISGAYSIAINARDSEATSSFYNPNYGNQLQTVYLQSSQNNRIQPIQLQVLSPAIPWQYIRSGEQVVLAGGRLQLDLTQATVLWANKRTQGELYTEFLDYSHIFEDKSSTLSPLWLYANQPRGLIVEGTIGLRIIMPKLAGSYDHLPPEAHYYVLMLGYHSSRGVIEAVGIGQVNDHIVSSIQPLPYTSLDYIGYTLVTPEQQSLLQGVVEGKISLLQLLAELQQANKE